MNQNTMKNLKITETIMQDNNGNFDPTTTAQELLKQLLQTKEMLRTNVLKIKDNILKEDSEKRKMNIPYHQRKPDFERLFRCEIWLDYLQRAEFSKMDIWSFAVEHLNDFDRIKNEALIYFENYVI